MKKMISLVLALAMLFSLAVPAMAAEPTVTGNKEGDVTANYTPVIKITDIVLSEYEGNGSVTVDEENKTYTINIPADANSQLFSIAVSGTNLDKITDNNYKIEYTAAGSLPMNYGTFADGKLTFVVNVTSAATGTHALQYSTDGGQTYIDTDWTVVVKKAEPVPSYSVKISENEEAVLSVDKTTAAQGETVTVTVTSIPEGYRLDGVNVYVQYGGFTAEKQEDGTYTFPMPDENVTVTSILTKVYAVKVGAIENGTVTADPAQAGAWETVTLNVAADQGYRIETLTVINDSTGEEVQVSEDHSFTMPNSTVTVTASFVETAETYRVEIGPTTGGTVTIDKAYYAQGDTVILTVTPVGEYLLRSLQYTDAEGNVTTIRDGSFVMPASNVTVTAEFYKPAVITGIALVVGGQEYTSGYAVATPDSTVQLKLYGTDLNNANDLYFIWNGLFGSLFNDYIWEFSENNTVAVANINLGNYSVGRDYEMKYQNPSDSDYVSPGLFLSLRESTPVAEITGVTITIDGVEYSSTNTSEADPAVITPNTQSLTLKVTGTNLQYNEHAIVSYAPSKNADTVHANNEWIVSEDGTSATKDISAFLEVLSSTTSVWELQYANDGDTLESSGVYVIYQVPTYAVNISAAIAGGTVTASPNPAEEGQTVTVTVDPVAGYAYVVGSLKVINEATGLEVPVDEASKTFTMPDSTVMVSAEFEKLTVTSADITWGSMAFTYTDGENGAEGAWTADAAEGAGTVTVENTGDISIIASAAYAPADGYTEITGSLGDTKTLAATESGTFTLTLSGKPNKAIPAGTKIGTVTIRITEGAIK
ncbi:MAG: hypothetical protein IJ351_00450 [Oscillospiraceae bacterium]|nr:hypothetical protein [Oscillospiraceae bacterium]